MSRRAQALAVAVRTTVWLLLSGAFLVVLGIFNENLDWDIFSPEAEKVLWGIFASCVALAAFGVAISFVLGIRDTVFALHQLLASSTQSELPEARSRASLGHAKNVILLTVLLALVVGTLAVVNTRIEARRVQVFRVVLRDQLSRLAPRLAQEIPKHPPCVTCTAQPVAEILKALEEQPFCQQLSLVVADPGDDAYLWRFSPRARSTRAPATFERFFIANDTDRAIQRALKGDVSLLDRLNGEGGFRSLDVIRDEQQRPLAVLRLRANPQESFRNYQTVDDHP